MTTHQKRRGFSLIESAIVLAVVGLVIGGIWVAASAVHEKVTTNTLVTDVVLTVERLKKVVGQRDAESIANQDGEGTNITKLLVDAGVAPKGWVFQETEQKLLTQAGAKVSVTVGSVMCACDGSPFEGGLHLNIYGISTKTCTLFVKGLMSSSLGPTFIYDNAFNLLTPVSSLEEISDFCKGYDEPITAVFSFSARPTCEKTALICP